MNDFIKSVIDLSVSVKSLDTPMFPIYPQPLRSTFSSVRDNGFASFVWTLVEHTGTHVDAPAHFVRKGLSIDKVPISKYVSRGLVLDFSRKAPLSSITEEDISNGIKQFNSQGGHSFGSGWILLFYTGYTARSRSTDWMRYPGLDRSASKLITKLGFNAIGIDAPGPDHEPSPAHKILLKEGVAIYENLSNLEKLLNKNFVFVGVPLKLVGGSASPTRAIALVI